MGHCEQQQMTQLPIRRRHVAVTDIEGTQCWICSHSIPVTESPIFVEL